jgi:hypothetical protein
VHEFRAKLDRDRKARISQRVHATTHSIASLEDRNVHTDICQPACSRQSRQAGTDHKDRLHGKLPSCFRRVIIPAVKTSIAVLFMGIALAACGGDTTPKMQPEMKSAESSTASQPAKTPDEKAAVDALRKINEAQSTHFKLNRRYALTFEELVEAHLLTGEPSAAQTGYEFKLRPAADAQTYKISVAPSDSSATARHFFTDEKGVIHAETGKDASADSPAVQ